MAEADVSRLIQRRIEQTKESLEDVDKNIRKLTGRSREEFRPASDQRRVSVGGGPGERLLPGGIGGRLGGPRRPGGRGRGQGRQGPGRVDAFQRLGVPLKRPSTGSAFSRLGSRVQARGREESDDEEDATKPALQSSVVATAPIVKSREDMVQDQQKDTRGQARNKRMFGLLLGTLHKFKQEATDLEDKNVKRAKIEEKLEKKVQDEKNALAQERKELFNEKRAKEVEMQRLEDLMNLAREQEEWNNHTAELSNFIYTKAKPRLFYMPKTHTTETKKKLQNTRQEMTAKVQKCKDDLNKQLVEVEEERNRRLERMAQRDRDQQEGKENVSKGPGRRRSDSGKGKEDQHGSSHERSDKRRIEHRRHRDDKSSDRKRRRTVSQGDDAHKKEKPSDKDVDKKEGDDGDKVTAGSQDGIKEELGGATGTPGSAAPVGKDLPDEEQPAEAGLIKNVNAADGNVSTEGALADVAGGVPAVGAVTGEGTTGDETKEPEPGKAGEYQGAVFAGGAEGGLGRASGVIPGIGPDGKDPDPTSQPESSGKGELSQMPIPDMDLNSIQLPVGPGKPILTRVGVHGEPANGEEKPPTGDFQIGGGDEQLDYNEAME